MLCVHHPKSSLLPSAFISSLPSYTTPPPLIPSGHYHTVVYVYEFLSLFLFFLLNSFTLSLQPLSPLTAVNLFSVSISLFLFCLLVYFVHYTLPVSEIILYLSLSDQFLTLSMILSWSIHTVTKGKISFFLTFEQCSIV